MMQNFTKVLNGADNVFFFIKNPSCLLKIEKISNRHSKIQQKLFYSTQDYFKDQINEENHNKKQIVVDTIKENLSGALSFFEKLLHMDEVIRAQNKVFKIKDELKLSSDKKRRILSDLEMIGHQLKTNHHNQNTSPRGTSAYIKFVTEEGQILEEEKLKHIEFAQADQIERDFFNQLTNAINESYAKERVYSHTLKNVGIIGTLLGCLLSFFGTSLGFYLQYKKSGLITNNLSHSINENIKNEIKVCIEELRSSFEALKLQQESLENALNKAYKHQEGWIEYFKRHSVRAYRWIYPIKKT